MALVMASAIMSRGGVGGGIDRLQYERWAVAENGEGVVLRHCGRAWGIVLVTTVFKAKATFCSGSSSCTWTPIKKAGRVTRKTTI